MSDLKGHADYLHAKDLSDSYGGLSVQDGTEEVQENHDYYEYDSSSESDIAMNDELGYDPADNSNPAIAILEDTAAKGVETLEQLQKVLEASDVWIGDTDWKAKIEKALK